ncbi:phytanoyl-CoA dioxygenase family protein [Streptosporangium sp. NPDC000509]|uniref:phytanoyl-CoA dioxygenase family protein n=1 Tax=Streptosporangium sp. NPDC000509 TaxID=3366186 RepID=UPI00368B806B
MPGDRRAVSSNGVPIPFTDELFAPLADSSALLGDPEALRRRFHDDGLLLLRGFLDREAVLSLRAAYLSAFPEGLLKPGTTPEEGVFSGRPPEGLPSHGVRDHPAYDFVRTERFASFARQPALTELASTLLGGPVRLLPRGILRHFYAGSLRASRAHTDHAYMSQGSDRVLTMWIPVGDCPMETGGLVYLEGSHRESAERFDPARLRTDRAHDSRPISHDLQTTARVVDRRWLWSDYEAGDLTVHNPYVVHASLDTVTDVMRVSADVRFIREEDDVDPRWMKEWAGDDGA